MKRIHIVPIDEASKPKPSGKAFLLPGSYSPYTVGHHEMARQAAAHAASTGHTHFYHGIGAASKQSADDPLTHGQKRSVIRSGHRDIAKEHKGMQFHTTEKEHVGPFHQMAHLARQGHKHITIGLGSDQMKGKLKSEIEKHVKKHGGILDKDGKVHKATVSFHQMGAERHEGDMPRHEVLARLRKGDMSVAKAGRLRKAVASGDTELAHELMPKHINKPKYFSLIQKQQARVAKPKKKALVAERYMSFLDFISEAPETVKTLILSGKKRKKKTVKEDIEIANVLEKPSSGLLSPRNFAKTVEKTGNPTKRSGRIAKGYTLHTSTHKDDPKVQTHYIVHDQTGHVAGEVSTVSHGDEHQVIHTEVHGAHTRKKIGKSLAALAYKHIAKKKGNLWSSGLQSPGGASVWNRLRKDPKMKGRVFHHTRAGEVPAHDVPEKRIWASDTLEDEPKVTKSKGTPSFLPTTRESDLEHRRVLGSRLVIRPLRKS